MKKILARIKDDQQQRKLVMPEQYKNCSIDDAVTMACSDAIYDLCKVFGINVNEEDEDNSFTNMTIELSNLLEKTIRDYYNIPENQVYAEGDAER
mgnify:CR=1 FL=1